MKKISKTKIAVTYANALFDAAQEKQKLETVFADVLKLREALSNNDDFVKYMTNPLYSENDKTSVLNDVAKKLNISEVIAECLSVMSENHRLNVVKEVLISFIHLYYEKQNIAEVEVDSAKKLSASQLKKLMAVLEKNLSQQVVVIQNICPELMGGLRIRVGSKMFDDTLATKLNRLEIMMKGEQ